MAMKRNSSPGNRCGKCHRAYPHKPTDACADRYPPQLTNPTLRTRKRDATTSPLPRQSRSRTKDRRRCKTSPSKAATHDAQPAICQALSERPTCPVTVDRSTVIDQTGHRTPIKQTTHTVEPEKSLSVSDEQQPSSVPGRSLRTTRSLSPRPPLPNTIIVLSDDNRRIRLDEPQNGHGDDDVFAYAKKPVGKAIPHRNKAYSDTTSPLLLNACTSRGNARSTDCLYYVPNDPWVSQRYSAPTPTANVANPIDPWVYRDDSTACSAMSVRPRSASNAKDCRMSADSSNGPHLHASTVRLKAESNADANRASMQNLLPHNGSGAQQLRNSASQLNSYSGDAVRMNNNEPASRSNTNIASQLSVRWTPSALTSAATAVPACCNVMPRHSFSTLLPPRDLLPAFRRTAGDAELSLNIRRLSEQIQGHYSEHYLSTSPTLTVPKHDMCKLNTADDVVCETTC